MEMCSNTMDNVYEDIDNYNSKREKILIVFDEMITDSMTNNFFWLESKNCFLNAEN